MCPDRSARQSKRAWRLHMAVTGACFVLSAFAPFALTAPVEQPVLLEVWRNIFARPAVTLQSIPAPPENPLTPAKVELGRRLFNDVRLSGDADRSCATCHRADLAYSQGSPLGPGRNGRALERNVPGLSDLAWAKRLFWDGRASSLEEQAAGPILHADEMGGDWSQITSRLGRDRAMLDLFREAYPSAEPSSSVTPRHVLEALAAYERTLVSPISRFDRYIAGDEKALGDIEREGFALFVGRAGCVACHGGWRFTDDRLHDIGLPGSVREGARRHFKTPTLRELTRTAPYMHDGSKATLEEVIDHYDGGFEERRGLSPNLIRNLQLSNAERQALVAFLKTLSSE